MVERKIIYTEKVILYLDELVQILYTKEYFGFLESAEQYVIAIYDYVDQNTANSKHYKTPSELSHLGEFYIFYSPNKRTSWYIFFEKRKSEYLITGILNNHCPEARFLGE
jgi:hypothetical protein